MSVDGDTAGAKRRATALLFLALVVGVTVRAWLVVQAPPRALLWDHHEYVIWSAQAERAGVLSLYSELPPEGRIWMASAGRSVRPAEEWDGRQICNYPPLAGYLFAVEGTVLGLFQDDAAVSNMRAARVVYSLPSFLGDVLLALGCLAIVRLRGGPMAGAVSAAVVFCAPPVVIDSARWGQTDSWVLAPAVWMVWMMMRRQWMGAGILWGVALGLKTQAILLAPIWMFAVLVDRERRRIIVGMMAAPAVLLVVALPFMFASGWAWLRESYVENLFEAYKLTTLKAFNVWYLDLLLCENDDASVRLLGLEKDLWGKILLGVGVLASGVLAWRSSGRLDDRLLRFAGALLLCAVILPTRVHERYILLPIPFLICAAAMQRRLWWGVVPLIVAASFQMGSMEWAHHTAEGWGYVRQRTYAQYESLRERLPGEEFDALDAPEERLAKQRPRFEAERRDSGMPPKEWGMTLLELAAAGACFALLLRRSRKGQEPRMGKNEAQSACGALHVASSKTEEHQSWWGLRCVAI